MYNCHVIINVKLEQLYYYFMKMLYLHKFFFYFKYTVRSHIRLNLNYLNETSTQNTCYKLTYGFS